MMVTPAPVPGNSKLTSYDRLFPNQDTMPKGGFGNLIALPLQKQPRESGWSVFVDEAFRPYPDQWAFLDIDRADVAARTSSRRSFARRAGCIRWM